MTLPAINDTDRRGRIHQPAKPVVGEAPACETLAADAPDGSERQVLLGRGAVVAQVQRVRRLDHLPVLNDVIEVLPSEDGEGTW